MKIIALEEHLVTAPIADAWRRHDSGQERNLSGELGERLADLGALRLEAMDHDGVDVQVLSQSTPGVQVLPAAEAVALARDSNDLVAAAVAAHPDRFQAFATLPTPDPAAAATELERTVTQLGFRGAMLCGRTGRRNLDDPSLEELWSTAERLGVPLYIHPQTPAEAVQDAYYRGFGDAVDGALANPAIGWHYETGVQLLRAILGGVFDRHPRLQLILGHWGEVVLFYAERTAAALDGVASLQRPLADYLRQNVFYTAGGILSRRYLRWTLEVVGADRVMFAADYPYQRPGADGARRFLLEADLSDADREQIAHGNWQRLTGAA